VGAALAFILVRARDFVTSEPPVPAPGATPREVAAA
jgi:hypothetical protein